MSEPEPHLWRVRVRLVREQCAFECRLDVGSSTVDDGYPSLHVTDCIDRNVRGGSEQVEQSLRIPRGQHGALEARH